VTFENCKQLVGVGGPGQSHGPGGARTAPMALVLYSAIVIWFHRLGHRWLSPIPTGRGIRTKKEPSFADMLTTLRRISWEEHLRQLLAGSGLLRNSVSQLIGFREPGGLRRRPARPPTAEKHAAQALGSPFSRDQDRQRNAQIFCET